MVNTTLIMTLVLNGIGLGILYLLIAAGMSVIFGITDILNFAHGALYMVGAYFAMTVINATGSFFLALVLAPLFVGALGMAIERTTLRRLADRGPLYYVLLTFGLMLILQGIVELIWGKGQQLVNTPAVLTGAVHLGPIIYPKYRLFMIGVGAVIALAVWAAFRYTQFGLIVRASAQDQRTVRVLGIDTARYSTLVFGLGSFLAGAAGALAGPILNVNPSMGNSILVIAFIVVTVGGLGSFGGSIVSAFLIGMITVFGSVYLPQYSSFLIYFVMFAVLIVRPQGLLGSYEIRNEVAKISFEEAIPPVKVTDRRVLALFGLLVVLPVGTLGLFSKYWLGVLSLMFIWGLLALSLDMVTGQIGLISFGHAAFYGVGAYAIGLLAVHFTNSFVVGVALAIVVTMALAWVIGALSMRLSGVYFAMITFASAQLLYQLSLSYPGLTGGSNGMGTPDISFLGFLTVSNTTAFYYLSLVVLVALYYGAVRIMDSPFGHVLTAIRESERRASFLGYNPDTYKRRAFLASGAIGGVAGALFVTSQTFVSPNTLYWLVSGDALFAMILGGAGTLFGPIVGGAVLIGLERVLSSYVSQWRMILGIILVVVVLFEPRGLVSLYRDAEALLVRDAGVGSADDDASSTGTGTSTEEP